MSELEKRTWHYVQKPQDQDIRCTKCGGSNLDWSEFARHVWCYDCEIDFTDYVWALSGPIPIQAAYMLGFIIDIYDLETKMISEYNPNTGEYTIMTVEEYTDKHKK